VSRPRFLVIAATTVIASGLVTPAAAAHDRSADGPDALSHGVVVEARPDFMTDLALVARARGWTLAQAESHRAISDSFGRIQQQVAQAHPDLYAGAALSAVPDGAPTLYIKGRADESVRQLVRSAGFPIEVADGRPFSWQELEKRSIRLNRQLAGMGFRDVVTSVDESTSTVDAVVTRVPSRADATSRNLLAALPAELRTGVRLSIATADTAVDEHAYGGMWVRDDGVNECTSGWAVTGAGGVTGVTTAGHCDGVNEIDEPGVGVHALTHQAEHRGQWGDVEWKTSTHIEPDDFYATATEVRDVEAVEPRGNITVGESVCVYGRSSNSRDCSHTVFRTSVSCTNNGVFNDRLVAMNAKNTTIGGDSGGGWSFNFTAYGSHKGGCTVDNVLRNVFSVADLYDEALGVTVRTS
jgi:hypothetical protein